MTTDGHHPQHALVMTVQGMAGRDDVRLISARVADVPGVAALSADLSTKTLTIEGNVSADAIAAAIASAGYAVNGFPT